MTLASSQGHLFVTDHFPTDAAGWLEPRAISHQLLLCLQTRYSAYNRHISCCSIPARLFLGVLLSLEVFLIVWRFSLNAGDAFTINVLIHFGSQTGHSSSLHVGINTEELNKDRSLCVNGQRTVIWYSTNKNDHAGFICWKEVKNP